MATRRAPSGGIPRARGEVAPAQREQHGSDLAVNAAGVQAVRTAVDVLLAKRAIGPAEEWAKGRWLRDYMLAVESASDSAGGSGGGGFGGFMDAKVAASLSYEAACEAVGKDGTALLIACVAHEQSLRSLAADRHQREWLAGGLAFTLKRLAEHYAAPPRRPRPPAGHPAQLAA